MADKYQRNQKHYDPTPSPEQRVVEGILKGLWWLVTLPFGTPKSKGSKVRAGRVPSATAEELAVHWQQVDSLRLSPGNWAMAISEADKIVNAALEAANFPGPSMADRLKAAQPYFSADAYNALWEAHRLRNRLAHEVGATAESKEVQYALYAFEQALRTLGVTV